MNNKEYWIERAIKQDKKIQKKLKKIEKELKKEFVKAKEEIKKELAYIYVKNNETEYQKYQLEATLKTLDNTLNTLYHNEENIINKRLLETYIDVYEDTIKDLKIDSTFNTVNESTIKEILKINWSGLTFSERIWESHLPNLKKDLKETIQKGLIRGDSLQDMARALNDKFNRGYQNSLRLVHTETCYIQSRATIDSYKEADLDEYEFVAFLDKRTSPQCRELDQKIFKVKDAKSGVNLPPLHPRCRSCVVPVIE